MPKDVIAQGSQTEIAFIEETTEGTTPTSGTVYRLRSGAESFDANQPSEFDTDVSSDGQKSSTIRGLNSLSGGFQTQLANGVGDPFFRSAMRRSTWTENSYDDTVDITASGTTADIQMSGSVSISGIIDGGLIKIAGAGLDASNRGVFRVTGVNSTTGVLGVAKVFGTAESVTDFTTEAGVSAEIDERYVKAGGRNDVTFTVEKRFLELDRDDSFIRLAGERVMDLAVSTQPSGAISFNVGMMGLTDTLNNDGMVGPSDWTVDGGFSAGVSIVDIADGSTNPQAGDQLTFADDDTATVYTATAGSGSDVTFSPTLQDSITNDTKIYFYRPATVLGDEKKMESILSTVRADGKEFCVTSVDLNYSSNLQPQNCVGNENAIGFSAGDRTVTGTMVPYLSSDVLSTLAKIRAGTTFELTIFCRDTSGNCVAFQVPKLDGDKELAKKSDANSITQNIPFKGLKESSTEASLIIHALEA